MAEEKLAEDDKGTTNIKTGDNTQIADEITNNNLYISKRKAPKPSKQPWSPAAHVAPLEFFEQNEINTFSCALARDFYVALGASQRPLSDGLIAYAISVACPANSAYEAAYSSDVFSDPDGRELIQVYNFVAGAKEWLAGSVTILYVDQLADLDGRKFANSVIQHLTTGQGERLTSELKSTNAYVIFVLSPDQLTRPEGRKALNCCCLDEEAIVSRFAAKSLNLSPLLTLSPNTSPMRICGGSDRRAAIRRVLQLIRDKQLSAALIGWETRRAEDNETNQTWQSELTRLLKPTRPGQAATALRVEGPELDAAHQYILELALFLFTLIGGMTVQEFRLLMESVLRAKKRKALRQTKTAAPAAAGLEDQKLLAPVFEVIDVNLLSEFETNPDAFLHPLEIYFHEYTALLDFNTAFKKTEAKKVLLQLSPIQIDEWMEQIVTGSPIFFECSEKLARKMASAYASWLESRAGSSEGFVIGRWWANLLKSQQELRVDINANIDPEIRKQVEKLLNNELKKWEFARRIAILLDAFVAKSDGVRLFDNALNQLQQAESFETLRNILMYFTERSEIDALKWIKVVLDRGNQIAKTRALHLLASMAENFRLAIAPQVF